MSSNRKEFSRKTMRQAFERARGRCERCQIVLRPGMRREYDHRITDYHSKRNDLYNCQVLCQNCHALKTKKDRKHIAKSERVLYTGAGVRSKTLKGKPMPGTKASGIKKKLDGTVLKR